MLIIFDYGIPIPNLFVQKKAARAREVTKRFLDQTDLTETEKKALENNIIVGANTNLFNLMKINDEQQ